ncbi:MAG: glycosyltransferase family 4 protein [Gemmatimonadota bacterium]|nr:glycosyltransferase family 4 protein [Gemmatimonadota bacterium]
MTRPSVRFVNQHYWPDVASTGQHLTDLAEYLADRGFEVSVLCGRGKYLAGTLEVPDREMHNGVAIRRLRTTGFGRGSFVGRAIDYAGFYVQALCSGLFGRKVDLVVYLTTPSLLSFVGRVIKAFRRQRYAVWSMDLHPEVEQAIGVFRTGAPHTRLLHAIGRAGDRGADVVVDLGRHMKRRLVERGVDEARTHTIPVWSRKDEIRPVPPAENPLRDELGLTDRFVVMYSGNAGLAHRFEELLEAMRRMKDDPSTFFLFVGGGPRRKEIEAYAGEQGIENFRYLDYFPREQLAASLSLGDAHLLTLRHDMAGLAVPGKLYGIMAAGRPVLVVGPADCESAETVARLHVGAVVDPEASVRSPPAPDPSARIVERLIDWRDAPAFRGEMGRRARDALVAEFERDVTCAAWRDLLLSMLAETGSAVPTTQRAAVQ